MGITYLQIILEITFETDDTTNKIEMVDFLVEMKREVGTILQFFYGDYGTLSDKLVFDIKNLWCMYSKQIIFPGPFLKKFNDRGILKILTMIL